jgi:predicted glycosyltransferase
VDCLTLPGFHKSAHGQYGSRSLELPLEELAAMRSASIRAAVEAFDPDLLIVDKAPRGACGELDGTLAWARRRGKARVVLGLRDILDEPAAVQRDWRVGDYDRAVGDFYDDIWVYGDQRIYDLAVEYRWAPRTVAKLRYLGYLDQRSRLTSTKDRAELRLVREDGAHSLVVCTVGGGQDGEDLAAAFLQAPMPSGAEAILVAGPFMPTPARVRLEDEVRHDGRRQIVGFLAEADELISQADRLVTMGGYNSMCAALSFNKPTLVVPRVAPRREQLIRAERLASRDLVSVLPPSAASSEAIGHWLASPTHVTRRPQEIIDMGGLDRLAIEVQRISSTAKVASHG